jgi:hypothetical protein
MSSPTTTTAPYEVVERVPGSSSTDFWGIAHVPSQIERDMLSPADLEMRLDLLRACWACFDDIAARVSHELRPGSRGGGRSRDQIVCHTYGTEPENWSRKVGVRTELDVVLTPNGLATHRVDWGVGQTRSRNSRTRLVSSAVASASYDGSELSAK